MVRAACFRAYFCVESIHVFGMIEQVMGGGVVKEDFQAGLAMLAQPVLPLVSMVHFLYITGPFTTVAEVIEEMPEPIETGYALYEYPRKQLRQYTQHLMLLEGLKNTTETDLQIVDANGNQLDHTTALTSFINQQIMADELEAINSALCSPCGCTLCCTGPDDGMAHEFFEIPLQADETALFDLPRFDTPASQTRSAMDDPPLQMADKPFYDMADPGLFHWQTGWSIILPRKAACPALGRKGRCGVYTTRPRVCRKPQIFCYIIESLQGSDRLRLRNCLLAITDCPYVQILGDEIAVYAAACELELLFKGNKQ